VSDRAGTATIHLGQSGNHSMVNAQGGGVREIETVTLDEFAVRNALSPDIVKIDVEGHESAVIEGAVQTLATHRPTVFMEYTPSASGEQDTIRTRMAALFSACFVVDEASGALRLVELAGLEGLESCNLILTNNDRHLAEIRKFAHT
jgi:hypothetical protein